MIIAAASNITAGQQGMSINSCPASTIHRQTDRQGNSSTPQNIFLPPNF